MQLSRRHFLGAAGAAGLGLSVGMPWKASADSNPSRVVTPGGGTDDHLIIQAALDRGGLVRCEGVFQLSDGLRLPPNTHLQGQGPNLTRFVQLNPDAVTINGVAVGGIGASGIRVEGGHYGASFSGVQGLSLDDVALVETAGDALACYSVEDFALSRVAVSAPVDGASGVTLRGRCHNGNILFLTSRDNGVQGVASDYGDGLYMQGDIQNIYIFRAVCSGNNRDGIVAEQGCDGITIDSAYCEKNGVNSTSYTSGIWVETRGIVNVDNCTIDQREATAYRPACVVVSGTGNSGGRVAHCTLRNGPANYFSIYLGRNDVNVYDNQIFEAWGGILLTGSPGSADRNTVQNNQVFVQGPGITVISAMAQASQLRISNNLIHSESSPWLLSLNETHLIEGEIENNICRSGGPGQVTVNQVTRSKVRGNIGVPVVVRSRDELSIVEGAL